VSHAKLRVTLQSAGGFPQGRQGDGKVGTNHPGEASLITIAASGFVPRQPFRKRDAN
jgi:hypothetical protein